MVRAEKDAGMSLKRVPARGELFNVPVTITLYYNSVISELCRFQRSERQAPPFWMKTQTKRAGQGAYAFIPTMAKLLLVIVLLSAAPLCAAAAAKNYSPGGKGRHGTKRP